MQARKVAFDGLAEQRVGRPASLTGRRVANRLRSAAAKRREPRPGHRSGRISGARHVITENSVQIPKQARGWSLESLPCSVRLRNILQSHGLKALGDLQGLPIARIASFPHCGEGTVAELRGFIRGVLDGKVTPRAPFIPFVEETFVVPANLQNLSLRELPLSVRLSGVLEGARITTLGDLNDMPVKNLLRLKNCGKKSMAELRGVIEAAASGAFASILDGEVGWTPDDLIRLLDAMIASLPPDQAEILKLRLGHNGRGTSTLAVIGAKFGFTRERSRQILEIIFERLEKIGSRRLAAHLSKVERACKEMVCPLTPELLTEWVSEAGQSLRWAASFYVGLLGELNPEIPIWLRGQDAGFAKSARHKEVERALKSVIESARATGGEPMPAPQAFSLTSAKVHGLGAVEFLETLRGSARIRVDFLQSDCPMVSVSKFLLKDAARMVLDASDRALGPEELLSRARARFPDCELPEDPEELARRLTGVKGFYLLGPVLFGLRRHFSLPERVWKQAKNDSLGLLKREKRLLSTYEIIEQNRFPWVSKTNAHELGCILREDPRFVDMGRFLFSIKRWGIKKREFVKDLIPRILEEAGKPLTGAEIEQRLRKFRSVSAHTVKSQLTYHPELRRFGQNCHGLKSWR